MTCKKRRREEISKLWFDWFVIQKRRDFVRGIPQAWMREGAWWRQRFLVF